MQFRIVIENFSPHKKRTRVRIICEVHSGVYIKTISLEYIFFTKY